MTVYKNSVPGSNIVSVFIPDWETPCVTMTVYYSDASGIKSERKERARIAEFLNKATREGSQGISEEVKTGILKEINCLEYKDSEYVYLRDMNLSSIHAARLAEQRARAAILDGEGPYK